MHPLCWGSEDAPPIPLCPLPESGSSQPCVMPRLLPVRVMTGQVRRRDQRRQELYISWLRLVGVMWAVAFRHVHPIAAGNRGGKPARMGLGNTHSWAIRRRPQFEGPLFAGGRRGGLHCGPPITLDAAMPAEPGTIPARLIPPAVRSSSPRQRFIAHIGLLTLGEHMENILAPESRICGGRATASPAPGIGVRDDLLRGAPLYAGRRRRPGSGAADRMPVRSCRHPARGSHRPA
jgi:hypothetical protein